LRNIIFKRTLNLPFSLITFLLISLASVCFACCLFYKNSLQNRLKRTAVPHTLPQSRQPSAAVQNRRERARRKPVNAFEAEKERDVAIENGVSEECLLSITDIATGNLLR